ncbi:MAG: hypothetical protein IPM24_21290 [Bryobacterales bacterium]|nr:hypothetical protein [Bryobacterales bacterium]
MNYLEDLAGWLSQEAVRRRIGRPVAARASFALPFDAGDATGILAAVAASAQKWFDAVPRRAYALGPVPSGALHALVEFATGETALLGVEPCEQPAVHVLLIGNHGTVEWTDAPDFRPVASLSPGPIAESLRTGAPVDYR